MKVLVTGGNGFIGKPLVEQLREDGHEVRTVGRFGLHPERNYLNAKVEDHHANYNPVEQHYVADLSREAIVRRIFNHWDPEVIIHLAANPNGKPDMLAPTVILDDNIKATQNLLHWCKAETHFLFASSIVVYGDMPSFMMNDVPLEPEPAMEEDKCEPTSLYGITKLASENLVKAYHNYRGINYKILRLCATVGPGLTHGILYDFIKKVKVDDKLEMLGDCPGSCKPYVHVNDVVDAFTLLMNDKRNATLNICSRWSVNVNEIADIVMEELGISKEKIWLGANANWKGDNPFLSANPDRATHFGWNRKLDSIEAIRQAVRENANV